MEKTDATVVDFTAGNRSIYEKKDHPHILYLDIEPELTIKPDILCDIRNLELEDNSKYLGIFDPPHDYGRKKNRGIYSTPSLELANKKWPQHYRETPPRYYGSDKYKSKTDLLSFIYESQKEIARVLIPRGTLLFKWNDVRIQLEAVLTYFTLWDEILRIPVKTASGAHINSTYWVMMMQSEHPRAQRELLDFIKSIEKQTKRTGEHT